MTEKWLVIAVLAVAAAVFILKGKPFSSGKLKGFSWSLTGLLIGICGIAAFWASEHWGGGRFARGLNFTTPTSELMNTIVTGDSKPLFAAVYALGPFKVTWSIFNVIGVPLGAYISARILKEHMWKVPPAPELITVFFGGLMMGFGGILGGGCTVGQALTGVTTLSFGSIVAAISMILGNWTMVYFKFIKPMND
ncbi:MAG: YeeE/YedE family protein [Nitrospirae bacterium]|nr:YeeE/YedE family protein [Nitrospirota bacterium]